MVPDGPWALNFFWNFGSHGEFFEVHFDVFQVDT